MNNIRIEEIQLYERDVKLRLPFRFGVITLTEAPQALLRLRVQRADGREAWGMAAEVLAPKWFDKNLELSNEDNFDQLRQSVYVATDLYTSDRRYRTPFEFFAEFYQPQLAACEELNLNRLIGGYGLALLDRAILDAVCRLQKTSFYTAVQTNLPGLTPIPATPELKDFDFDSFLSSLEPANSLHARHTVGLSDPIDADDQSEEDRLNDGLPETLVEVIQTYGQRYFKLKVGGSLQEDLDRLEAIASVLDSNCPFYFTTLDGNEQYSDLEQLTELWQGMKSRQSLKQMLASILFIEQPVHRNNALEKRIPEGLERPVIIDESDVDLDAFPRARELGYRGVSSKTCKGMYKSIINRARCRLWNREEGGQIYFMSGEDLTLQPGISVQQDLALVSLLGLEHLERNGHHYVAGLSYLPRQEQEAFLKAHPDLYIDDGARIRINLQQGKVAIGSLHCTGFASAAEPLWETMRPMTRPEMAPIG